LHCGFKKSDDDEKREEEFGRLYACQNCLSQPHQKKTELGPLGFFTN
jgi:hypothetical protein